MQRNIVGSLRDTFWFSFSFSFSFSVSVFQYFSFWLCHFNTIFTCHKTLWSIAITLWINIGRSVLSLAMHTSNFLHFLLKKKQFIFLHILGVNSLFVKGKLRLCNRCLHHWDKNEVSEKKRFTHTQKIKS